MYGFYSTDESKKMALATLAHRLRTPLPRAAKDIVVIGLISFLLMMGYVATESYAGYMADCAYCYSFGL